MKIRVVFGICVLVAALGSCAKKDKSSIENTEPVVDFDLEAAQEPIPEPDRFVSAIVLSPSTKLYLQGRDKNMHSIFNLKNNDTIEILLAKDSDRPEINLENETYIHFMPFMIQLIFGFRKVILPYLQKVPLLFLILLCTKMPGFSPQKPTDLQN